MLCGVAQTAPRLGEPDRNLAACLDRLEEAAALGCKLVVLPECAVSGYMLADEDEAARAAETVPGPSVEALEQACARLGLHCVAGLLERDGARVRNTAVLVGPEGLVSRYRKTHLPSSESTASSSRVMRRRRSSTRRSGGSASRPATSCAFPR
jgi:predicted amidohydrolase